MYSLSSMYCVHVSVFFLEHLKDEELVKVYLNNKDLNVDELLECFTISNQVGEVPDLVKEIIEKV